MQIVSCGLSSSPGRFLFLEQKSVNRELVAVVLWPLGVTDIGERRRSQIRVPFGGCRVKFRTCYHRISGTCRVAITGSTDLEVLSGVARYRFRSMSLRKNFRSQVLGPIGRVNEIVVPFPATDCLCNVPPCFFTLSSMLVRPKPLRVFTAFGS